MSRSLYSLDREVARKLLTKNNLAKPPRVKPGAQEPEEETGFAQIKEAAPKQPHNDSTTRLPTPVRTTSPEPVPVITSPDPRQVEQEEKWLLAQVRIKELEETLAQVALDGEKMASFKQKSAEMEGHNRLLVDQLESLDLKLKSSDQKVERLVANLETFKTSQEEAEKLKAETTELKTRLTAKEAEALDVAGFQDRVAVLEMEKTGLLEAKKKLEDESKEYEAKLVGQGIESSKIQADMRQLQHDLELEKEKTAASAGDAEQILKLKKQVETARDLLNKAADDNVRLEKERVDLKGKLQASDNDKAELSKQKLSLETEKQQISGKLDEANGNLAKLREEILQLNVDWDSEKAKVSALQPEADLVPGLRKDLEGKSESLEKAVESGAVLEKERDDLRLDKQILEEKVRSLEQEKESLAQGKQTAEADRVQFSAKLNELGKDLLKAQTEAQQLKEELETEKSRPLPDLNQQEIDKLKGEAGVSRDLMNRAVEDKAVVEKERNELKEQIVVLELEVKKSKDGLKQAVMAYHEARTNTPGS